MQMFLRFKTGWKIKYPWFLNVPVPYLNRLVSSAGHILAIIRLGEFNIHLVTILDNKSFLLPASIP